MKRTFLPHAVLSALMLVGGVTRVFAASAPAATPATPAKQLKVFKIAEIKGAEAVETFQHDIQVMQTERKIVQDLQASVDKEKNAQKKKELQTQLDAAVKKMSDDNATMAKTYGFSLTRDYTLQIEALGLYLHVTDEEAANLEKQAQQQKAQAAAAKGKK